MAEADVAPGNVAYDGRIVFVRLKYEMPRGLQTGLFGQDIKWAHDYPRAEKNLSKILEEISSLQMYQAPNGGNVLALDDPELHKFPFAYMAEPGFYNMKDCECIRASDALRHHRHSPAIIQVIKTRLVFW